VSREKLKFRSLQWVAEAEKGRAAENYLPSESTFPRRTTMDDAGNSYSVALSACRLESLMGPSGCANPGLYCCSGSFGSNGKCDGSTICCAGCHLYCSGPKYAASTVPEK